MFSFRPKIQRYQIIDSELKLKRLVKKMWRLEEFAFDTETNTLKTLALNKDFCLVGISISWGEYDNYYIPLGHKRFEDYGRQLDLEYVVSEIQPIFEREDIRIIGQNLKFDLHTLARVGIIVKTKDLFDVMIASWLCDENTPNGLKDNSALLLGIEQTHFKEVIESVPKEVKKEFGLKPASKATFDLVLIDDGAPYALDDSFFSWELYLGFVVLLEEEGMHKVYNKLYKPFIQTLFLMEEHGITVDIDKLDNMKTEITKDMDEILYRVLELAGVDFNPSSSQQLAKLLFGYVAEPVHPAEAPVKKNGKKWSSLTPQEKQKKLKDFDIKMEEYEDNLAWVEKYSFKFKPISVTKGGAPQTSSDVLWKLSKFEFKKTRKREGVELCTLLGDYKKLDKLRSAFIEGLKEQLYDDGKAHPSFNIIGTDSGRLSCISEGTPITLLNGDKEIQDVEIGDLAYCYDEYGKLHLRKVLNVFNNGVRDCVKVYYKSTGKHTTGVLTCTPDHKILTHNFEWVRADELKEGDKVLHLRRSINSDSRPRLFGYNSLDVKEQTFVKGEVFGNYDSDMCIHHKDLNKTNNELDNLELLTRPDHTRLHTEILLKEGKIDTKSFNSTPHKILRGKEHPRYKDVNAKELEAKVRAVKGDISKIDMDFNTFKTKCAEVGFDYKKVAGEYKTIYREVKDEDFIKTFFECKGVPFAISKALSVGRTKVSNTIKRLDLCYNHSIIKVEKATAQQVYDLEVEEFHNFIASELCVHNCSKPNLQQLPKADEEDKYQIRSLFIGSEYIADKKTGKYIKEYTPNTIYNPRLGVKKRKKIIALDFSNLEMRVLTHFSEDKNLLEMFASNADSHGSTAVNMFELNCDASEVKKMYPHLRQAAKIINFLLMYGGGARTLYLSLRDDRYNPIDLGDENYLKTYKVRSGEEVAQIYIDKYFASYSGVASFIKDQKRFAHRYGFVQTLLRRKRRLPNINSRDFKEVSYCERLSVNSSVQGSAADITASSQVRVYHDDWFEANGVFMLLQVHDELVFECPEDLVEESIERVKRYMEHPFGDKVELNLELKADADFGDSYADAK